MAVALLLANFVQIVMVPLGFISALSGVGFDVPMALGRCPVSPNLIASVFGFLLLAAVGVWASDRVATRFREKDPQYVVIDEVSGQHLTLLLGCGVPIWWKAAQPVFDPLPLGLITLRAALNWKYLLLGFILFRVFDIWKPFPARQAESLPGGWGIMADDWIAGIYAAIGVWLARAAGF